MTPKYVDVELQKAANRVATAGQHITTAVGSVVDGKADVVRTAVTVLLAEGHLLVEDVPGVGKTMLARALARALGGTVRRIQFTPDLLPGDVTGVSVYDPAGREFEFKPGPVFANVVIADEINRASPKTQSALLECMAERQVSVDGQTRLLNRPFLVVATQNPADMEGTYPLPESQRDRFLARVSMGYPSRGAELEMFATHGVGVPLDRLRPVTSAEQIVALSDDVRRIHVALEMQHYLLDVVGATRRSPDVALGASPRASLHLLAAARAAAALQARPFVLPDDVQRLATPVLAHRLLLTPQALHAGQTEEGVVAAVLRTVPVPGVGRLSVA